MQTSKKEFDGDELRHNSFDIDRRALGSESLFDAANSYRTYSSYRKSG